MDLSRQDRFRSAADSSTSVEQLLELAMEFPDQVAVNPALALAIVAEPACLDSADPVALACLLTSPMISANLSGTLTALARGRQVLVDDPDRSEFASRALDAWAYREDVRLDFSRPGNRRTMRTSSRSTRGCVRSA